LLSWFENEMWLCILAWNCYKVSNDKINEYLEF
jgi:hypothetical protein